MNNVFFFATSLYPAGATFLRPRQVIDDRVRAIQAIFNINNTKLTTQV